MKPYIMNYSQSFRLVEDESRVVCKGRGCTESTKQTFVTEGNDDDFISNEVRTRSSTSDNTIITETVESIDQDEIMYGSTLITRSAGEDDDQDYVVLTICSEALWLMDSTVITKSLETIDTDSIH